MPQIRKLWLLLLVVPVLAWLVASFIAGDGSIVQRSLILRMDQVSDSLNLPPGGSKPKVQMWLGDTLVNHHRFMSIWVGGCEYANFLGISPIRWTTRDDNHWLLHFERNTSHLPFKLLRYSVGEHPIEIINRQERVVARTASEVEVDLVNMVDGSLITVGRIKITLPCAPILDMP